MNKESTVRHIRLLVALALAAVAATGCAVYPTPYGGAVVGPAPVVVAPAYYQPRPWGWSYGYRRW